MNIKSALSTFLFFLTFAAGVFFAGFQIYQTVTGYQFEKGLSTLTEGLEVVSETNSEWKVTTAVTSEELLIKTGRAEPVDGERFFRTQSGESDWHSSGERQNARRQRALFQYLKDNCDSVKVFRSSDHIFILAERATGPVLLSAEYIET